MAAALLVALVGGAAVAAETEVGTTRRLGIGLAAGFPTAATLKLHVRPEIGLSLHLGPTLVSSGLHVRIQAEHLPARLRRWSWGELRLGWQGGVAVELLFGAAAGRTSARPAVLVGVGAELRLVPAPVGLFAELSPMLFPADVAPPKPTGFQPFGLTLVVGARWTL